MSSTARPIESYLPTENLTLKGLLEGFGRWWMDQPSLSSYKRYYSADDKAMVVWEGYPGTYDSYGSFAEDDHFYNEAAKSYQLFWHLSEHGNQVRVWGTDRGKLLALSADEQRQVFRQSLSGQDSYSIKFNDTYASLSDLRHAMITVWAQMQPTLGSQGESWKAFVTQYRSGTVDLLQEIGQTWLSEDRSESRHALAYPIENYVYLVRWIGDSSAVKPPETFAPFRLGFPVVERTKVKEYSVFCVSLKRLPVGFSVEKARGPIQELYYVYLDEKRLGSLEELRQFLAETLPSLPLDRKGLQQ